MHDDIDVDDDDDDEEGSSFSWFLAVMRQAAYVLAMLVLVVAGGWNCVWVTRRDGFQPG